MQNRRLFSLFCLFFPLAFLLSYRARAGAFIPSAATLEFLQDTGELLPVISWAFCGALAAVLLYLIIAVRGRVDVRVYRQAVVIAALAVLGGQLLRLAQEMSLVKFLQVRNEYSAFADAQFVDPHAIAITPEKKRNLLVLSLESMDNIFARRDVWGKDHIAKLTALARDNLAFSDYRNGANQFWTMASLVAVNSGMPFINMRLGLGGMVDDNEMTERMSSVLPHALTLPDILARHGFQTLFVSSGLVRFSNTLTFLRGHAFPAENIFAPDSNADDPDLREAVAQYQKTGRGWWGFSDEKALQILQKKLTAIAARGHFYAFFSSIDTHPGINPYLGGDMFTAYQRAAALVPAFLRWARKQPWYADTSIVIIGDHASMKSFPQFTWQDHRIYNCFLNVPHAPGLKKERIFNQVDLFPTLLEAAGFAVPGGRLGWGTSLFSGRPTLVEEHGRNFLGTEFSKRSRKMLELWQ